MRLPSLRKSCSGKQCQLNYTVCLVTSLIYLWMQDPYILGDWWWTALTSLRSSDLSAHSQAAWSCPGCSRSPMSHFQRGRMLLIATICVAPTMYQTPHKCFRYPLSLVIRCILRTTNNKFFYFFLPVMKWRPTKVNHLPNVIEWTICGARNDS